MINTHDEAALIVEMFENMLDDYNITVPSDEDSERDQDNMARLYGSTYYDLLSCVEEKLIELAEKIKSGESVESYVFSGNV